MTSEDASMGLTTVVILQIAVIAIAIPLGMVMLDITPMDETNVETEGAIEDITVDGIALVGGNTDAKFTVNLSQGDVTRVELYRQAGDGRTILGKTGVLKEEDSATLHNIRPKPGEYTLVAKRNETVVGTVHLELTEW